MAYMGNLVKGDRVKVTIEAEVKFGSSFGVDLDVGNGIVTLREDTWGGIEFEKIEPPVEVFKPGDTVRDRNARDYIFTIGRSGYLDHLNALWNPGDHEPFTSKEFERVSLDSGA